MNEAKRIRDLQGLGVQTEILLQQIEIHTVAQFMAADPIQIYAQVVALKGSSSMNLLYAMVGAQEGRTWLDIAKTRRSELLLALDDLGIAPVKSSRKNKAKS